MILPRTDNPAEANKTHNGTVFVANEIATVSLLVGTGCCGLFSGCIHDPGIHCL